MPILSLTEYDSLTEVGTGIAHGPIPALDAARLLELGLIYNLFGDLRITKAGRARLLRPQH